MANTLYRIGSADGYVDHVACADCIPDRMWIRLGGSIIGETAQPCEFCGSSAEPCAECGETMADADPISPFVCNACADPQPCDDDYVIQDGRSNDSRDHVFQNGRELFACYADVTEARIRALMDAAQFWPNVWRISDHGNAALVTMGEETDPNRAVYVSAIYWRYNDPLVVICAMDRAALIAAVETYCAEEIERESDPDADVDPDDLVTNGITQETLGSVIETVIGRGRDADESLAELIGASALCYVAR